MKILTVIGTRPEAIKLAPVLRVLTQHPEFESVLCVTGQHKDMVQNILDLFQLKPDIELKVMQDNQDLTSLTVSILTAMQRVLIEVKPDLLMIQGDTTTCMAASLSAYYAQIPLAHVEAGLRTGNNYSPWPEEINRKIAGSVANLHFAPTDNARKNLLLENVPDANILVTGNTVIDAIHYVQDIIGQDRNCKTEMISAFPFLEEPDLVSNTKKLILVTGHRRESFGKEFENICYALRQLATRSDVVIVYPVHLNPNVQEPVFRLLSDLDNIKLLPPLDYKSFVYFMGVAYFILTDSGGIQEEAPSIGTPVLVMRDVTERDEAIREGVVKLVGTSTKRIVDESSRLLEDIAAYNSMSRLSTVYGDGKACGRIIHALEQFQMAEEQIQC